MILVPAYCDHLDVGIKAMKGLIQSYDDSYGGKIDLVGCVTAYNKENTAGSDHIMEPIPLNFTEYNDSPKCLQILQALMLKSLGCNCIRRPRL